MREMIRFGDICGYDDAEVIDMDDDVILVIESEENDNETIKQDV